MIRILTASILTLSFIAPVSAAPPPHIPLQGVLRDNAGAPVSEGAFEMTFSLYESAEAEEAVWTETRGAVDGSDCIESPEGCVTVVGGQFRVQLGAVSTLDTSLFSSAPNGLWLGVSVEGEPELPRRPMGSTPFALYAGHAAGLSCTGCVSPEALGEEALQTIRSEAVAAVEAAGYNAALGTSYDGSTSGLAAETVQDALDDLKAMVDELSAGGGAGNLNEGAGTVRTYSNQWGLPSYGTAREYIHVINPNPPKVLLHLYGGENTGFASSNNLIVSNSYTPNTYSGQANGEAGDDTLTVSNAGAFNQGDHILIHQTVGDNHGTWELNAVTAINGNSLKLAKALTHAYTSNSDGGDSAERAQVVIAASYNTFEVVNGGTVSPSSSLTSGDSQDFYGGIVYIRARQLTVKNGGVIHADHAGFNYGDTWNGWSTWNRTGRSECNVSTLNRREANCSGGGGGYIDCCSWSNNQGGGGGGGNRTAGNNGSYRGNSNYFGFGGSAKGAEGDGLLHMGGGGGSIHARGGRGGGLVVLGADTIIVESGGRISADGEKGYGQNDGGNAGPGGGGGAGGTVALYATTVEIEGTTRADGGSGGDGYGSGDGGAGGAGWVTEMAPIAGVVNQSYATGVEIWIDGEEVTPQVGDPNAKGSPHWDAEDEAWGDTGTEPWSSGPLDLTNAANWTLGEHTLELKETGGAGGDLKAYLYLIQTFTESSPPVNDTCTSPVALDFTEGPVVLSGTTEDVMGKTKATDASAGSCGGAGGPDAVYRIDLDERSLINVTTVAPYPVRLYIREGACSDGEEVYCAEGELQTTPFEPGTYYLWVDSDSEMAKGDYTLAVSLTPALLPTNDTCETATELIFSPQGTATDSGSTLYSLGQYQSFCGGELGPDVVYRFTAGTGQIVTIETASSEFDPIMYLYKGGCGDGEPLFCSYTGILETPPQAGGEYYLVIDGSEEKAWGAYDMTITLQ